MDFKLVVLSDIHLMAPGEAAHDLGNMARLEAAVARINAAYGDADLVIFAGDLADRGRKESYEALRGALETLGPPHALTIGNHDDRAIFAEVFGAGPGGFIHGAHDIGGARVIVLDSVVAGPTPEGYSSFGHGGLCAARLAWLEARLEEAAGRPVIVALHHPPLHLGITTDRIALQAPEPLLALLKAHGDVRQVLSGHIHMTTTTFCQGIPFTTLAGNFSNSFEDYGRKTGKARSVGPAEMAVVLGRGDQVTVFFDRYWDAHDLVTGR